MIWDIQQRRKRRLCARWAPLAALVFVIAQIVALHHSAEHDAGLHHHNGQVCTLSVFHDGAGGAFSPVLLAMDASFQDLAHDMPVVDVIAERPAYGRPTTRAPPMGTNLS